MSQMDYRFKKFYRIWSVLHSLFVIIGLIITIVTKLQTVWYIIASLSFLYYLVNLPGFLDNFPLKIGYANIITLFRLITILVTANFREKFSGFDLLIIFLGVILMDGLDGIVARKYDQSSKAGEAFDMEVDAFFVFVLSYIHYENEQLGIWILIPGGLRYIYELIFFRSSDPPVIRPSKRIRSTVAVIFFFSLLFPFIFGPEIYFPAIIFSSSLIIISFGISAINRIIFHFSSRNLKG